MKVQRERIRTKGELEDRRERANHSREKARG